MNLQSKGLTLSKDIPGFLCSIFIININTLKTMTTLSIDVTRITLFINQGESDRAKRMLCLFTPEYKEKIRNQLGCELMRMFDKLDN